MAKSKDDDFLGAVEADNLAEAGVEATEQTESAAEAEPEAEPEQPEVPPAEPTPEPAPDAQNVPLSALLDERDRRKAEADRAAMLEAQLRQITQSQQPVQMPDPLEDPEGYQAFVGEQIQRNAINSTLNMSEVMARSTFGDDVVNAAQQWAKQRMQVDPYFQDRLTSSPHPYQMVVNEYQRDTAVAKLGDATGIDEFLAWKAAQQQLSAPQQQQPAPTGAHQQQAPPKSIASAPSAGGVSTVVEQTDGEMFDEVISGLR